MWSPQASAIWHRLQQHSRTLTPATAAQGSCIPTPNWKRTIYLWGCQAYAHQAYHQAYATGATLAFHPQHEHRIDLSPGLAPLTHNTTRPGGATYWPLRVALQDYRLVSSKACRGGGSYWNGAPETCMFQHISCRLEPVIFMHEISSSNISWPWRCMIPETCNMQGFGSYIFGTLHVTCVD